jgi:hypothetical protein
MKKARVQTYEIHLNKAPWKAEIKADTVAAHDGMVFFTKADAVVACYAISLVDQITAKPHHFAVVEEAA